MSALLDVIKEITVPFYLDIRPLPSRAEGRKMLHQETGIEQQRGIQDKSPGENNNRIYCYNSFTSGKGNGFL